MIDSKSSKMRRVVLILSLLSLVTTFACSGEKKAALKAVEDSLKPMGVREVTLDKFLTSTTSPDVAFVAVTATWGFGDKAGKPTKEQLGYLLRKNGQEWKIDKALPYDPNSQKSRDAMKDLF